MNIREILGILLLVVSQLSSAAQPKPETSEYILTRGGGAIFDSKNHPGQMYVGLNLTWVKEPPVGTYLVAEFSNPKLADKPLVIEQAVDISSATFVLKSPMYACVVNNSQYEVAISLFTDQSKTTLIGKHTQQIGFSMPTKHFGALKMKECDI